MEHTFRAAYQNCLIRPLRESDIEHLRVWRNNTQLSRYLTPIPEITPAMQLDWFHRSQSDPNILTFAVEETLRFRRLIGSVSLYDFQGTVAEVGKIMIGDDEARGKSLGFYSNLMTAYIGFEKLGLTRVIAHVHEENQASMKCFLRIGYTVTGRRPFMQDGYECELECSREHFYAAHPELPEISIQEETTSR